jgi:tail-anchored protein insertion receptor
MFPMISESLTSKQKQTYDTYLRITLSPTAMRQRALKSEILSTKSELLKTSAQDQFAKWAKLRRSVDKGLADLEKLSKYGVHNAIFLSYIQTRLVDLRLSVDAEVASSKSAFAMKFNTLLWLLTTGLQFAVGWWYRKQPVFFLPQGWLGPLGWWLALPFAPAGTPFFLVLRAFQHDHSRMHPRGAIVVPL